jgi:hypothetical protein
MNEMRKMGCHLDGVQPTPSTYKSIARAIDFQDHKLNLTTIIRLASGLLPARNDAW